MGLLKLIKGSGRKSSLNTLNAYNDKYYNGLSELQAMWSVMYNLKIFTGEQAEVFEKKCYENLTDLNNMLQAAKDCNFDDTFPREVPAYIRLAMLYEKQAKYEQAIEICVKAIQSGATEDGSSGKMYGRLARMIKKSGIQVGPEVLKLTTIK